jgi:hypothetical protein
VQNAGEHPKYLANLAIERVNNHARSRAKGAMEESAEEGEREGKAGES